MNALEFVLLHSPLVGPGFWRPVAQLLEARGFRCWLPTAVDPAGEAVAFHDWPRATGAGLGIAPGAIVVGHSAAGLMLPSLARMLEAGGLVFVDALIPPDSGAVAPADADFLEFVRRLPRNNGLLPRWSRWWGDGVIEQLIGDADAYERFEAELPQLPQSWFDDTLEVPPWRHLPAGYLQTSQRFSSSASEARERHWPVRTLTGTHLHPFVDPQQTAEPLLEIVSAAMPPG